VAAPVQYGLHRFLTVDRKTFCEFKPLSWEWLAHLPLRSRTTAGRDTSHVLSGFVELRCCAACAPGRVPPLWSEGVIK
jgi:hypothetical protein